MALILKHKPHFVHLITTPTSHDLSGLLMVAVT